ncbi:MAG: UTP--glucose-1-phosphate uridylyltransferase, partial [Candidatus Omnitrophica bacterium]|nr:UTP--glucose-1-phosphate uridylyltransferase [Candidatus Omnitrophota bacterium]
DTKPAEQKQSYRQKMEALKIKIPSLLEQADLPWIEENTGNITLKPDEKNFRYRQTGGHGQWGFYFLWNICFMEHPQDGKTRIRVFYNGDNLNSRVSKDIVGKMKTAHWPIVKLTTVAMPIDKKGGKDGVRFVNVNGEKVPVPAQMEEADAKVVGQTEEFYSAGQEGGFGEPGKQPFNTNIFYINETLLHDILKQLAAAIGEERFKEIISPSYIQKSVKAGKDGNKYIPIDGAIGTAMHNLNEFFMTSTDPEVKKIAADLHKKFGIDRLLYFVDVPRTEFFTPVKFTSDIYLQTHTDYYKRLDGTDWILEENADKGQTLTPPEITLGDPDNKEDTAYWKELQNLIDALGEQKVRELKSLVIKGKIKMVDARLKGNVEIVNASGQEVDLKQLPEIQKHIINGELVLDNLKISIDGQGQVQVQSSSPVSTIDDGRVTKDEDVGGIDMNAIDLDRKGAGVDIQFDPAELQEIIDAGIDGFAPVIINITPLPSVLPLLGLDPANKEEHLEVSAL